MTEAPLLAIENLAIALPQGAERPLAVDNISLTLARNEILCIVGESGSGKSMTAHAVMGLLPQPHVRATAGRILYQGEDLLAARPDRLRALRGHKLGMIFQEPMTALHPIMRVEAQITEVIQQHAPLASAALRDRVTELLLAVGLPDPDRLRSAWPHRLSGGQRQRVMIAMALALGPDILIADEPTTALDVTTQAQILALIRRIQAERQMGVMLITHDFGVVADIADQVAVLQRGILVESGPRDAVLNAPQHPYTQALIEAAFQN
jgi:peptide/nickel transport system ATP-binding protein